jgi:hypothetical protein
MNPEAEDKPSLVRLLNVASKIVHRRIRNSEILELTTSREWFHIAA